MPFDVMQVSQSCANLKGTIKYSFRLFSHYKKYLSIPQDYQANSDLLQSPHRRLHNRQTFLWQSSLWNPMQPEAAVGAACTPCPNSRWRVQHICAWVLSHLQGFPLSELQLVSLQSSSAFFSWAQLFQQLVRVVKEQTEKRNEWYSQPCR